MMYYLPHHTGLDPKTESGITLVCLGIPAVLGIAVYLVFRRRLKKFYEENEYRVFGEVVESQQVYANPNAAKWELTVRFTNESGDEETAQVMTWNRELAKAKSVELALVPSYLLMRPDPSGSADILHPRCWAKHVRLWEERNVPSQQRYFGLPLPTFLLMFAAAIIGLLLLLLWLTAK